MVNGRRFPHKKTKETKEREREETPTVKTMEETQTPKVIVRSFFCATDRGVTKTQTGGTVGDPDVPFCPACGFRMQEKGVSRYAT